MWFVDVPRELNLIQATADSILKTLCDKGWLRGILSTRPFSIGSVLAAIAAGIDLTQPLAHAARMATADISQANGYPASVIERVGDWLIITAFEGAVPTNRR
jgi:hypothetical protein